MTNARTTGADAPRSWLHVRMLLQICVTLYRGDKFSTGGLRPPLLVL
jgi:hypothetical protein